MSEVSIPTAAIALATAILPAFFVLGAVHTLRRRRDNEKPVPESVDGVAALEPPANLDKNVGDRLYAALQAVVLICTLVAVVHLLQRSPEQKCARSNLNLRHAELYASKEDTSSLPASANAKAQGLFDAALMHAFGFDHIDALALFESAAKTDPECSMCIWGKAYTSGPFINRAIYEAEERPSYPVFSCSDAVEAQEIALQSKLLSEVQAWPPLSQVLADAMVQRYTPNGDCTTAALQQAELQYAGRVAQVAYEHQVATIAALAAEAYMNAYAWNYTISETSAVLREEAATALELINYALSLEPMHVLALHLKIHLLETQPLKPLQELQEVKEPADSSVPDVDTTSTQHHSRTTAALQNQQASLHAAEAAADTLAGLRHVSSLPGHLIHMPAHIFFRVGRWKDGIEASVAAVNMNKMESQACFSPYAPEHNLDTGLVTALLAGDYKNAQWAAESLQQSQNLFRRAYVSDGTNHAAAMEVALYFGRCNEVKPRLQQGARGRSSSNGERYVRALGTLREVLCIVQLASSSPQKYALSGHSTAWLDDKVSGFVKSLALQAAEMPEDVATVPGFGVGLYSAGYHTLVNIFALVAKAAEACLTQNWALASDALENAVQLEFSMGYIEPPRLAMSLRPCLASVLLMAGDVDAAKSVVVADLKEFPNNWWGLQVSLALSSADVSVPEPQAHSSAMEACKLLFGHKGNNLYFW